MKGRVKLTFPQKKIPSKSPALLGLKMKDCLNNLAGINLSLVYFY